MFFLCICWSVCATQRAVDVTGRLPESKCSSKPPHPPTTAQSSAEFVSTVQPSYCLLILSFLNLNLIQPRICGRAYPIPPKLHSLSWTEHSLIPNQTSIKPGYYCNTTTIQLYLYSIFLCVSYSSSISAGVVLLIQILQCTTFHFYAYQIRMLGREDHIFLN